MPPKINIRDAFTKARKSWGGNGSGSTAANTASLAAQLPALFERYKVKRVVDLGCGDVGWILDAIQELDSYVGVDVVPDVIERNTALAKSHRAFNRLLNGAGDAPSPTTFQLISGPSEILPSADLVLVRDCAAHLSNQLVRELLQQCAKSSPLVLISTFPGTTMNTEIKVGSFRPLNLEIKPFNLPAPLEMIVDSEKKQLGLWRTAELG